MTAIKTIRRPCIFHSDGSCTSDYGNKIKCSGVKIPKKCPYKFKMESLREKKR